ncbi:uncharacterized protein JCM6883_002291 [Sporobolomyces salmoneus]|uniref:uncharacterized protein n=1 Tax=Sporobolomyces salmoneus TaxID=183962 RepID=UPI0031717FD4
MPVFSPPATSAIVRNQSKTPRGHQSPRLFSKEAFEQGILKGGSGGGPSRQQMSTRTALHRLIALFLGFLVLRWVSRSVFTASTFASHPRRIPVPKQSSLNQNLSINTGGSRCYWSTPEDGGSVTSPHDADFVLLETNSTLEFPRSSGTPLWLECHSPVDDSAQLRLDFKSTCPIPSIHLQATSFCLAEDCNAVKASIEISGRLTKCRKGNATLYSLGIRRRGEVFGLDQSGFENVDGDLKLSTNERVLEWSWVWDP